MKIDFSDNDLVDLSVLTKKYCFVFLCMILIVVLLLFLINKENSYQNIITIKGNKGTILVDKKYFDILKKKKELIINDVRYDYNIEKVEDTNNDYLVTISFPYELDIKEVNYYQISLGKENIFKYLVRIMGG